MKKTITAMLVTAFIFVAPKLHSQWSESSTHPHNHLQTSIADIVYDPHGTGQVIEDVAMYVDLSSHPGLYIVSSSMYVSYETWDDHFILADFSGTSNSYAKFIEYNWNDNPYWLSYSFEVTYSDGTYESKTYDVYF